MWTFKILFIKGTSIMKSKLKLIIAMLIFGTIGIFVKNIPLSSIEIAFSRALLASLFLLISGAISGGRLRVKISFLRCLAPEKREGKLKF